MTGNYVGKGCVETEIPSLLVSFQSFSRCLLGQVKSWRFLARPSSSFGSVTQGTIIIHVSEIMYSANILESH